MKYTTLIALLLLAGCTQADRSRELLEAQGYKDVQVTGYNFLACSEDDTYHTGFTAISPAGRQIKGTVCAGLFFKGATIRFE
jgi:hypothetical protein